MTTPVFQIKANTNTKPRTNYSQLPSIFDKKDRDSKRKFPATQFNDDNLSDTLNLKKQKVQVVIPKQENTILFKSDLEKQAVKELTDGRKSKFETNVNPTKVIEMRSGGQVECQPDVKLENGTCVNNSSKDNVQNVNVKTEAPPTSLSELQKNVEIGEDADYSQVQVSDFGMGMLLGMGWNKSAGIGKTFKANTESIKVVARPRGLGLGANLQDRNQTLFAIGDFVKIIEGKNKDSKGVITSMDVENVRVTIQTKNGRHLECSELSCIKYDQSTSNNQKNHNKEKGKRGKERYSEDKNKISLSHLDTVSHDKLKSARQAYERVNPAFLIPDITVRVIDDSSQDYKKKFIIRSVLTPYLALLDNGREAHQSFLESVIPKKINARVAITKGQFKGCVGLMNDKDKKLEKVILDFWDSLSNHHVEKFGFDDVSEYNG